MTLPLALLSFLLFVFVQSSSASSEDLEMSAHKTIYEFSVKDKDGKDTSLEKYRGQVVIIVNVASQCGFTNGNYKELKFVPARFKELEDKYHEKGLRVAAFPCNQFGGQEPACELDISNFVKEKFSYEPDLYAKVKVNGDGADEFWQWLKKEQGGTLLDAIKWNFTKFLVDRKGHVVKRYAPTSSPASFEKEIEKLLEESA